MRMFDTLWVLSGLGVQKAPTVTPSRMQFGGLDKAIFAIYLSDEVIARFDQGQVNRLVARMVGNYKEHFPQHYIALEGARCLGVINNEELLRELAKAGIKYLTMVHNKDNIFCTSATDSNLNCGLTRFGAKLLAICEETGVRVDVSHASDRTIADILAQSSKPVIASHSGCREQLGHVRNLTDDQIIKIGLSGGVVCVPFARKFVGTMDGVADHIDHIIQVTGSVGCVGIGSDLDGAQMVEGVTGVESWGTVVMEQLSNRGYSDKQVYAVAGGNLMRTLS